MGDILKPTLMILADKFDNLKCEPIKAKRRGAPVERYYFTFTAEKQIAGQTNFNDAEKELNEYNANKKKVKNKSNNIETSPSTPKTKEEWDDLEKKLLDN